MQEKLRAITELFTYLGDAFAGIVRPLVTLGLTGTFCYLAIKRIITPEIFSQAVMVVIAFWFATRDKEGKEKNGNGSSTNGNGSKTSGNGII